MMTRVRAVCSRLFVLALIAMAVASCANGNNDSVRYGTVRVWAPLMDPSMMNETLSALSALGPSFVSAATSPDTADITINNITGTIGVIPMCVRADTQARTITIDMNACRCAGTTCYSGISDRQFTQSVIAHAIGHWEGMGHVGVASGIPGVGNVMDGLGDVTRTASGFEEGFTGNTTGAPTAVDVAEFERVHP